MPFAFNPFTGSFDYYAPAAAYYEYFLKLDQSSPQTVINGAPTFRNNTTSINIDSATGVSGINFTASYGLGAFRIGKGQYLYDNNWFSMGSDFANASLFNIRLNSKIGMLMTSTSTDSGAAISMGCGPYVCDTLDISGNGDGGYLTRGQLKVRRTGGTYPVFMVSDDSSGTYGQITMASNNLNTDANIFGGDFIWASYDLNNADKRGPLLRCYSHATTVEDPVGAPSQSNQNYVFIGPQYGFYYNTATTQNVYYRIYGYKYIDGSYYYTSAYTEEVATQPPLYYPDSQSSVTMNNTNYYSSYIDIDVYYKVYNVYYDGVSTFYHWYEQTFINYMPAPSTSFDTEWIVSTPPNSYGTIIYRSTDGGLTYDYYVIIYYGSDGTYYDGAMSWAYMGGSGIPAQSQYQVDTYWDVGWYIDQGYNHGMRIYRSYDNVNFFDYVDISGGNLNYSDSYISWYYDEGAYPPAGPYTQANVTDASLVHVGGTSVSGYKISSIWWKGLKYSINPASVSTEPAGVLEVNDINSNTGDILRINDSGFSAMMFLEKSGHLQNNAGITSNHSGSSQGIPNFLANSNNLNIFKVYDNSSVGIPRVELIGNYSTDPELCGDIFWSRSGLGYACGIDGYSDSLSDGSNHGCISFVTALNTSARRNMQISPYGVGINVNNSVPEANFNSSLHVRHYPDKLTDDICYLEYRDGTSNTASWLRCGLDRVMYGDWDAFRVWWDSGDPYVRVDISNDINDQGIPAIFRMFGYSGASDLINANNLSNKVGINTSAPNATLEVIGDARLGDGTNYSEFEADGTLHMIGNATVFNDLVVNLSNVKAPAANPPTYTAYKGSEVPAFSAADPNVLYFSVQMPHWWKEGTDLKFHIHVAYPNANAGNSVWQLTYSWANIDAVLPAPTTVSATVAASGVTDKHVIHDIATISGAGQTISSVLLCSISRLGNNASDTYASVIYGLNADFHIEMDTLGSRQEIVK